MFSIHKFFRGINRNLRNIIIAIIVIIFVIGIIQFLNNIAKEDDSKEKLVVQKENEKYTEQKKSYSVITEDKIDEVIANKNINVITEFVNFCNEGKIDEAYELLSDECKNIYYRNLEEFKEYYYNNIFITPKVVDMQAWVSSNSKKTYKVELWEDILSSGNYNKDSYVEEYYTIITDKNGNKKININSLINVEKLEKEATKNNIKINCIQKEVYKEYEIYTFEVFNNTDERILLDSREKTGTVYLEGENQVKYTAFMHELSEYDLEINPRKTKEVKIKFNKFYNPDIRVECIMFKDVILNNNDDNAKTSIKISIK